MTTLKKFRFTFSYGSQQIMFSGKTDSKVSVVTLCDAFAIDGLICRDNVYEINTWCKVHSFPLRKGRVMFVEMFNDEYEEIGTRNDQKRR